MQYDSIVIEKVLVVQRGEEMRAHACLPAVGRFVGGGGINYIKGEDDFIRYTGHDVMGEKR